MRGVNENQPNPEDTDLNVSIQVSMSRVMSDVGAVAKTRHNQAQNFDFRGVDEVVNAVSPALQNHGVIVVPHLDHIEYEKVATSNNKLMMSCRVVVTYRFLGRNGDVIEATVAGEAFDSGDKATAKAMSVAFRTALLQALALPTDDPDPDTFDYEASAGHAERGASSQDAASGSLGGGPGTVQQGQDSGQDGPAAPEAPGEGTIANGEGAATSSSGASSATAGQWDLLMAAMVATLDETATVASVEKKVVNRINMANRTSFRDINDAHKNATVEQLDATLDLVK